MSIGKTVIYGFIGSALNVSPVEGLRNYVDIVIADFYIDEAVGAVILSVTALNGVIGPFSSGIAITVRNRDVSLAKERVGIAIGVRTVEGLLDKSASIVK